MLCRQLNHNPNRNTKKLIVMIQKKNIHSNKTYIVWELRKKMISLGETSLGYN